MKQPHVLAALGLAVALCSPIWAQTSVDLRTQSKSVDFSSSSSTRPVKLGTTLPGSCAVGELYFKTDANPGENLYACVAANTWTGLGKTQIAGDVSGSLFSATVGALQGRAIGTTAPTDGQVLQWNASSSQWKPATVTAGSSTPGAVRISDLKDFQAVRTSNTVLTVGDTCTSDLPCNFRFGNKVFTIIAPAVLTLSATAAEKPVFIYLSTTGTLTAGYESGLSLTCTGCELRSGITAFPPDAIALYQWRAGATTGTWNSTGSDYRAALSGMAIRPGTGIVRVTNPSGDITLSADPLTVALRVSAPTSATSTCSVGQWAVDSSFVYFCVAANSWKRAAMSSW